MADEKTNDRGQGKRRTKEDRGTTGESSGGAGRGLASTLRSTVASSQLASVLNSAAGGRKDDFTSTGTSDQGLREWLTQDLRSTASSSSPRASGTAPSTGFRTNGQMRHDRNDDDFAQFGSGSVQASPLTDTKSLQEGVGSLSIQPRNHVDWEQAGIDPHREAGSAIASYTDLDAPLHNAVRGSHTHRIPLATTGTQPLPPSDIFALLDAEEESSAPPVETSSSRQPGLSSTVLHNFDTHYTPPSPTNSGFSAEQAAMHLALAEAQAAEQGQQELLVPRPDNASAREGVYAPTAQDAFHSIFHARPESSTSHQQHQHLSTDGETVVRNITRYFAPSTYLDDVYGLPPLLRETIDQATNIDGHSTEQNRQIAIRRLESLWNHITNTAPPSQPSPSASHHPTAHSSQWVDAWLRTNT